MPADKTAEQTAHPLGRTIRRLRRAALACEGGGLSDGQLLECYLARRDEAAFETLVRRHGPMVLGVCRRVVGNIHDAEDAFQATFLVLVRKAAGIGEREAVGNWLFGVAYRAALKARAAAVRRKAREKQVNAMPEQCTDADETWHDLRPLLDRELARLPAKYRTAILLCDLQGRSRRDAAHELRLPEGTLSSRLAAGRKMLAARLTRRGIALSAGALAVVLAQREVVAAMPSTLLASTIKAAGIAAAGQAAAAGAISIEVLSLTEGVLKAMWMTKLKIAAIVLLAVGVIGSGATLTGRLARADAAPEAFAAPAPAPEPKKETAPQENPTAVSPDGSFLVSAAGKVLTLVETRRGKILWKGTYHKETVTALIFTPDGKIVYSAGKDAAICATDAATGKQVRVINHKGGVVVSLSLSPDNKILMSTEADGTVRKWDNETGESVK